MSWLGLRSAFGIAASAIIGAAAVTTVVLILGLRGRADGSRLILAGVAFSMTVSGIQSAITLLNPRALDAMRAWSAGSLASPDSKVIAFSLPILAVGALIAFLLVRPMDALALGDDLARGLGSHPWPPGSAPGWRRCASSVPPPRSPGPSGLSGSWCRTSSAPSRGPAPHPSY